MSEDQLYEKAIDKWGVAAHIAQAVEELAELIVALNHHYFRGKVKSINVIEEIADVEIMLDSVKKLLGKECKENLDMIKYAKLVRLQERLDI